MLTEQRIIVGSAVRAHGGYGGYFEMPDGRQFGLPDKTFAMREEAVAHAIEYLKNLAKSQGVPFWGATALDLGASN